MLLSAAQSQVVVGVQGGFMQSGSHNDLYRIDVPTLGTTTVFDEKGQDIVAGVQLLYQFTPWLRVGVTGGYSSWSTTSIRESDYIYIDERAHSSFRGMTMPVQDHTFISAQSGWYAGGVVKCQFVHYGNMHFNVVLEGIYSQRGYSSVTERYTKTAAFTKEDGTTERGQLEDFTPVDDGVRRTSIDISLRPSLEYEFSQHLSAELSLDILSVGYAMGTTYYDSYTKVYDGAGNRVALIDPHEVKDNTFYAGLNTLTRSLPWEGAALRLGFNWRF